MANQRARSESAATQRMQAAGIRATDAHASVKRHAKRLTEELDEVTAPHGVQVVELSEEDSLVTSVTNVIAANKPVTENAPNGLSNGAPHDDDH